MHWALGGTMRAPETSNSSLPLASPRNRLTAHNRHALPVGIYADRHPLLAWQEVAPHDPQVLCVFWCTGVRSCDPKLRTAVAEEWMPGCVPLWMWTSVGVHFAGPKGLGAGGGQSGCILSYKQERERERERERESIFRGICLGLEGTLSDPCFPAARDVDQARVKLGQHPVPWGSSRGWT